MIYVRASVIVLIVLLAFARNQRTWANGDVNSLNDRCDSVGTSANTFFANVLRKQMDEAISQGDWQKMRLLIWDGADPDWTLHSKWHTRALRETLNRDLIHASAIGNGGLIVRLIHEGADVNVKAQYDDYMSPLIWAARCNQASAARLLIDNGADVNITADFARGALGRVEGSTPLMWAAWKGNLDTIKVLLANGANPNAQPKVIDDARDPAEGERGDTALLQSANIETTKLLLKGKADPNLSGLEGKSPLMRAALAGDLEQCKLLLAFGADPHLKDTAGHTAADLAEEAGHPAVAALLTKASLKPRH